MDLARERLTEMYRRMFSSRSVISYLQAIHDAQLEEMRRDDRVFLMGEDAAWRSGTSTAGCPGAPATPTRSPGPPC
jgi:hypothetical protein